MQWFVICTKTRFSNRRLPCSNTSELFAQRRRAIMKEVPKLTVLNEDNKEVCAVCQKKVIYRFKGVEGNACLN